MVYQAIGSKLTASGEPVVLDIGDLGDGNGSLFYPFTTTLVEIVLNREPSDNRILKFLGR